MHAIFSLQRLNPPVMIIVYLCGLCRHVTSVVVVERAQLCVDVRRVRVVQTTQETQAVHALPDDDPRAGVREQLLHHASEALGDRLPTAPH